MTTAAQKAEDKAEAKQEKADQKAAEIGLKEDAHAKKEPKLTKEEKEAEAKVTALKEASDSHLNSVLHKRLEQLLDTCTDDEIKAELKRRGR
jgi:hypothetical protein